MGVLSIGRATIAELRGKRQTWGSTGVADLGDLPVLESEDRSDAVGVIIVDTYWPLAGAERDLPDGGFSLVDE